MVDDNDNDVLLKEAVSIYEKNELKKKYQNILEDNYDFRREPKIQIKNKIKISLIVRVLLIGLVAMLTIFYFLNGSVLSDSNKNIDTSQYADLYLSKAHPSTTMRGSATAFDTHQLNALEHYKNEDYHKAGIAFQNVIEASDSKDIISYFYFGLSNLYSDKYELSIEALEIAKTLEFNQVMRSYDEIQWYLALAYIKNGQKEKSFTLLKKIVKEDAWNHAKAKKILDSIE